MFSWQFMLQAVCHLQKQNHSHCPALMQLWGQQHPFITKRFKTFTCLHSVCLRMKCRMNSSVNFRDTESSWPPWWHLHDLVCDLNCFSDIKEMTWNKARKRYIRQSNPQTLYWPEFTHCFLMWRLHLHSVLFSSLMRAIQMNEKVFCCL